MNKLLFKNIFEKIEKIKCIDHYTYEHLNKTAFYCEQISKKMGFTKKEQKNMFYAGMFHDIGKLFLPKEILTNSLEISNYDFELIKTHTTLGAKELLGLSEVFPYSEIISQHHERLDGTGYPLGIKGDDIDIRSRIISVADVADAIISDRSYRKGLGIDYAIDFFEKEKGRKFDLTVSEYMIEILEGIKKYFL